LTDKISMTKFVNNDILLTDKVSIMCKICFDQVQEGGELNT